MRRAPAIFASGMKDPFLININARMGVQFNGVRGFLLPLYELGKTVPWVLTGTKTIQNDQGLERQAVTTGGGSGIFTRDLALGLRVS